MFYILSLSEINQEQKNKYQSSLDGNYLIIQSRLHASHQHTVLAVGTALSIL